MRVYVPATLATVERMLVDGEIRPTVAHAVTPALREAYAGGDADELEYVAMLDAARSSLRLLVEDPHAAPRRAVIAADVADDSVVPGDRNGGDRNGGDRNGRGPSRSAVRVLTSIPLRLVASAHVDDAVAAEDVEAARQALPKADAGDEDAAFVVDGAEGHELMWYATQELGYLG